MKSKDDLKQFVVNNLKDRKLFIATNREPYQHTKTLEGIVVNKPAGGAHTLLDLVARTAGGTYIAYGDGNADRLVVDNQGIIKMPPLEESYSLKRIFLTKEELENYYYGFANQTLWPLCHAVFIKPEFSFDWWKYYQVVNQKFADAILEEVGNDKAFAWINDYHLCLVPRLLKDSGRDIKIGTFWHIPWPTNNIFRINPWAKDLLAGLLGSDFLSFHRDYHIQNFFQCVGGTLEAQVDYDQSRVVYKDHTTRCEPLPAGIDYQEIEDAKNKSRISRDYFFKKELGVNVKYLILGVDRVDYIKGLIERFRMIDRFLEKYPDFIENIVYFGIMPLSRQHIQKVRSYREDVFDIIEQINWKYSKNSWRPIYMMTKSIPREKLISYYKNADLCLVTSLDDGMNLVAKEYVLSCEPENGMLVLSKFTGAAKDLRHALLVNPHDIEEGVDAIFQGLTMDIKEKTDRNLKMREELQENNVYSWAINFIGKTLSE